MAAYPQELDFQQVLLNILVYIGSFSYLLVRVVDPKQGKSLKFNVIYAISGTIIKIYMGFVPGFYACC